MGNVTTINKANINGSYKTSIPSFIIPQFGLSVGDKLEWLICAADNGEFYIKVVPKKA